MPNNEKCPRSYETYIDIVKPERVKCVIQFFFDKLNSKKIMECKKCKEEFSFAVKSPELVEHLRTKHYHDDEGLGLARSYEIYLQHLREAMVYEAYQCKFSKPNPKNLKLSFGVSFAKKFTLVRFPECRKNRTIKSEKKSYKSDWQKKVCETYIVNPVGSYQGHFDRPMTSYVYNGDRPLSFREYTEFTHFPPEKCDNYKVNHEKYEILPELKKIEALEIDPSEENLNLKGPCSKDYDMSILYTCIKQKCIIPCVCKECVMETKQCQTHQILHPGYFDPDRHAMTIRSDDSQDINMVTDEFNFKPERRIEVIKYAGIEKDSANCVECPIDLLHHQSYHFVHHSLCKFCINEEHKYIGVKSLERCHEYMRDKYDEEKLSCHLCNRLFRTKHKKDLHIKTQHKSNSNIGMKCRQCDRVLQSKVALIYHQEVTHQEAEYKHHCDICQKSFKTKHSVNVHKRSVHNRRKFYCRECFSDFKLNSHLLRHLKNVHDLDLKKYDRKQEYHACTICDFRTVYKQNLNLHMESAHSVHKETFTCEICRYQFRQKSSLTRHRLTVHADKEELKCQFCSFSSKYEYNLLRHKSDQHEVEGRGTGIRNRLIYSCKRCDFTTSNEDIMFNHNVKEHKLK